MSRTRSRLNPRRIREHRAALERFRHAYITYLLSDGEGKHEKIQLRHEVTRAIPPAEWALNLVGSDLAVYPPPALGGYAVRGLSNVAFAHERVLWADQAPRLVDDVIESSLSALEELERAVHRDRLNPLYWGDRFLRSILGFPVYLLSLVLGVSTERLDRSPWGTVIRAAELLLGGLGVYFGGRGAGWW